MPSSYSGRTSLLDPSPRHVRELPMDAAQAPKGVVVDVEALAARGGSGAPAAPKVSGTHRFLPFRVRAACLWKCLLDLGFVLLHEREGSADVRCSC